MTRSMRRRLVRDGVSTPALPSAPEPSGTTQSPFGSGFVEEIIPYQGGTNPRLTQVRTIWKERTRVFPLGRIVRMDRPVPPRAPIGPGRATFTRHQ